MSKLKITIERKEEQAKTCKHQVGGVYKEKDQYYLLVCASEDGIKYQFIGLSDFVLCNRIFYSLREIDVANYDDIPVDAELIIREVQ